MATFQQDLVKNRVALVTGGATGIGKGISISLGEHGAKVVIASRKQENLDAARAEFEGRQIDCLAIVCDIREPEQVESLMAEILAKYGRLDILVNCAAGNFPAKIEGLSYNGFRTVVAIDLLGTYNVSKAAFEAYLKDNGGSVVNITAPFAGMGVPFQAHAASAKAGVDSLTRTCAAEWGPLGIRVNAIAPGAIDNTEGLDRLSDIGGGGGGGGDPGSGNPLRRVGTREDIANAILFLVSDASSYVTGQILNVDGGGSMAMSS
ncbi:MAG: SDR family oxidoreductase [Candidatus Binatia bacterium]|nr:SDR family oxidoreductase [Candidatus Binatia bacterium]